MSELVATAVVTGGSRGIGRAVALALAGQGHQVFLTYVSKPDEAREVVETIRSRNGRAEAFQLDVSDGERVAGFFAETVRGKVLLSALVNNAGITKDGLLIRMKDDAFDRVIDVNLRGTFHCLREAAKIMMRQESGSIVNIGSVVGQMGNAGQINYSAAKAAVIGMTKTAAKELGARNIRVNCVCPGFIETDMTAGLSPETKTQYASAIPLGRFGSVEDVADAVAFLASDKARYVTGQVLAVNGGLYC